MCSLQPLNIASAAEGAFDIPDQALHVVLAASLQPPHYPHALPILVIQSSHTKFTPVEVAAGQAAPVAAVDHAIGVQHGHDLEHKAGSQGASGWVVGSQKVT